MNCAYGLSTERLNLKLEILKARDDIGETRYLIGTLRATRFRDLSSRLREP